jgi:adenylate cyclase
VTEPEPGTEPSAGSPSADSSADEQADEQADERADPPAGGLRQAVVALGVDVDEVDQAEADGVLELVALEHAITTEPPTLSIEEVAERSGVDQIQIRAFWLALGFPDPRPGERVFTTSDVDMLAAVVAFIEDGAFESGLALQMARVIGSSMARIATAEVDALESQVSVRRQPGVDEAAADQAILGAAQVLPLIPQIMDQVWRRHLGGVARRRIVRATADEGEIVCVGFADLVGFTAQTQELPEHQLAEVVGRFETLAFDLTGAHHGRVVKMIGDEVMFTTDDVFSGAALAVDMAATFRNDEALSDVRVGMASGRVLERDGDVFGTVVNLASRIVNVAYPGAVVVSQDIHDALVNDTRFTFRSLRSHYLKDIGRVPLWALRSAEDGGEQPYARARRRRSNRATALAEANRESAEHLQEALVPVVPSELVVSAAQVGGEATTEQIEAISEAVLDADIDHELRVELLAEIETSRRLHELELEARGRADQAELEAERRVAEAEAEARRKVEEAESEAHRKVADALAEVDEKTRRANEAANRKVKQAVNDAERKAEQAKRDARRKAKRKAERKKRDRSK